VFQCQVVTEKVTNALHESTTKQQDTRGWNIAKENKMASPAVGERGRRNPVAGRCGLRSLGMETCFWLARRVITVFCIGGKTWPNMP